MSRVRRESAGRLAFVVASLLAAVAQAQPIPTAEFASTRVYTLEDSRQATVQVTISGGPQAFSSISLMTVADTADNDDFVDTAGPVYWQYQEAGTKDFTVEVRVDSDVEPDERFFIDLVNTSQGYIELGARTRAEVIILNDDGPLRPLLVIPPPFGLSATGRGIFLSEADTPLDLTVRINGPAPAGFFATYQLDGGPVLQLPFEEGATEATLTLAPPTEPGPTSDWGLRSIDLVDASANKYDGGSGDSIWPIQSGLCVACLVQSVSYFLSGHDTCPDDCDEAVTCKRISRSILPSTVVALRAYRDNVLSTTAAGQFYVGLYDQLSSRIATTMFERPALFFQFEAARGEWIPGFQALADGEGANYFVTPNMQNTLIQILDTLETSSKPAVVQAVQRERTRLVLDSIAGLTMNQLQERLETLGGEVPTQEQTWGSIKTRFGEE